MRDEVKIFLILDPRLKTDRVLIVSTPLAAGGLVIFENFPLGGAGKFFVCRGGCPFRGGAPKSRGRLKILINFVRM